MVRWLAGLAMALLLAACGPGRVAEDELAEMNALWDQVACASVQVLNPQGGSGSGVVVGYDFRNSSSLVVTCAHVVMSNDTGLPLEEVLVRQAGGKPREARVEAVDLARDLALLRTLGRWGAVARTLQPGEGRGLGWGSRIVAFGHSLGEAEGMLTDGRITSVDDNGYLRYSAATVFGNSGGGIFARVDGRWTLISISQRISQCLTPQGVFVPYVQAGRGARPDVLMHFLEVAGVR